MAAGEPVKGRTAMPADSSATKAAAVDEAAAGVAARTDPDGVAAYVAEESPLRLWGLTSAERLRRSLRPLGVAELRTPADPLPQAGRVLLLRGDHVYDEPVIEGLLAAPGTLLEVPDGAGGRPVAAHVEAGEAARVLALLRGEAGAAAPTGLRRVGPGELGTAHRARLRKRSAPYVLALSPESLPQVERRTFAAAYKGVTDLVTKYVWPLPARWATRVSASLGVHPNVLTGLSFVLVLLALYWFAEGRYGAGLAAAWVMTFLDTVDGKLARLTLTSSKFGNAFDHGIDLLHPPFWYLAWGLGLSAAGAGAPPGGLGPVLAVVVGGYVLGRLVEGLFIWRYGIEIHAWRPIDSAFRTVTARRNPNLLLLTAAALAGRPELGLAAVAAWTAVSLGFHLVRLVQALAAAGWSGRLESWLAEDAGTAGR